MSKLVTLTVGELVEKPGWYRAIKDKVTTIEQYLLDCLPALQSTTLDRLLLSLCGLMVNRVSVGFAHVRLVVSEHWPIIIVAVAFVVVGFVRLVIIGVMVLFRVDGIVARPVSVAKVIDGVLQVQKTEAKC